MLLEVIACSVHDAIAAARGGAGRLELVRELRRGGLTPPVDLVEKVMTIVNIPVRVMIRETDGYAAGDPATVDRLTRLSGRFAALGVHGVVIGFLRDGGIDAVTTNAVLEAASPVNATFHHAFDDLPDPIAALEEFRHWPQIDRVLTSGGGGNWNQKAARIGAWAKAAPPGIGMLAGGGVDLQAMRILAASGVSEVHAGRAARMPPTPDAPVSSDKVAELVAAGRASERIP